MAEKAPKKEIPMSDEELDALMDQLESETVGMVMSPTEPDARKISTFEAELKPELEPVAEVMTPVKAADPFVPAKRPDISKLDEAVAAGEKLVEVINKVFPEAAAEVDAKMTPEVIATAVKKVLEPVETPLELEPESAKADVPKTGTPAPKGPPELQFYIDVNQFIRDISISDTGLDKCMMEQAGLRAYHGAEEVRAEMQADRTKLQVEVAEAKLFDKHRRAFADDPTIKVTEKMVENAVRLDPAYARLKNRLIEAEGIATIRKRINIAIGDRRDMLIQMGADRREDGKGQLRTMADQQDRADLRNRALKAAS